MADFLINVVVNTRGAEQGARRIDRSLGSIERSIQNLGRLLTVVFGAQLFAGAIRGLAEFADSLLNAQNRVRSLGIEGGALAGTIDRLFGVANRTRQEFATTAEVFTRTAASLQVLGLGAEEALALTESLNQAVALSGSTTAEASNALIQFSQGLASGTLRGDELRSVLEQIPVVADVIAQRLGVTRNELRQLAADGTITPQLIVEAFRDAREELAERFAALIPTISQSFVVLRNRVLEVGGGFAQSSGATEAFSRAILSIADNIEVVLRSVAALVVALSVGLAARALPLVIAGFNALTLALLRNPFTALGVAIAGAIGFLTAFADEISVTEDGVTSLADVASVAFDRLGTAVRGGFSIIGTFISEVAQQFSGFEVTLEDSLVGTARAADALLGIFAFLTEGIRALFNDTLPTIRRFFQFLRRLIFVEGSLLGDGVESIRESLRLLGTGLGEDVAESFGEAGDRGTTELLRRISLGNGPITEALRNVLVEAGQNAQEAAGTAGEDAGRAIFGGLFRALAEEQRNFNTALRELVSDLSTFLGLSEQEFGNFISNVQTILGGADLGAAFQNVLTSISTLIGTTNSDLVNAFGGVFAILNELGFSLEDVFGRRGALAVRLLGAVTSEQFQSILRVGQSVFTTVVGLIGQLIPAFGGASAAAGTFGTTATAAGTSASAAFAPLSLVLAGITALVLATLAIFGVFGERVQRIATILAVIFAPFLLSIQLIIRAVEFLIDLFGGLGSAGSTVANILSVVFAPIVFVFRAIIEVVEFLRDAFSSLGSVGSTVAAVLAIVFAPVLIPIQLIITAVEFLIDLFSNLGSVGSFVSTLLQVVLAPIVIPIQLIIEAIQFLIGVFQNLGSIGQAVTSALGAALNVLLSVGQAVFQGLLAAGQAVFAALQAVGSAALTALQGAFQTFLSVAQTVLNGVLSFARTVFGGIVSVGQSAFSAIQGAVRTFGNVFSSVFASVGNIARNVFEGIANVARSAFDAVIGAARNAASVVGGILGDIGNAIGGIAGGIGNIGGGFINFGRRAFKKGKKFFKRLFADGGVITGPVGLAGEGLGGKKFQRGGLLPDNTILGGLQNVAGTSQLGLAGEAGPEAILPLTRTSSGLGVTANIDDLVSIGNAAGGGSTTIINETRVIIVEASNTRIEEIEERLTNVDGSVETRSADTLNGLLAELGLAA
jgi:tape measure domain-containing protein